MELAGRMEKPGDPLSKQIHEDDRRIHIRRYSDPSGIERKPCRAPQTAPSRFALQLKDSQKPSARRGRTDACHNASQGIEGARGERADLPDRAARQIVLQVAMQDIGQLTDISTVAIQQTSACCCWLRGGCCSLFGWLPGGRGGMVACCARLAWPAVCGGACRLAA